MRILLVGAGGREHALGTRLAAEGHELHSAPGHPGLEAVGCSHPVPVGDAAGHEALAAALLPDLVVIGPEQPLADGLSDRLMSQGHAVFGPSRTAARIETSKAFAKALMREAGVATPEATVVTRRDEAREAIARRGGRCVVKQDGLAAGKGVTVCDTAEDALAAASRALAHGPVLVEDRLEGEEFSCLSLSDGERVVLLPPARDHKRLIAGDRGPNTGGMGAVCPVPLADGELRTVREGILRPVLAALAARGTPFRGALYAGLMRTREGLHVLEFNARLGDPETQAVLAVLPASVPLGEWMEAAATGRLGEGLLEADGHACCVTLAAEGYPGAPRTGDPIEGLAEAAATGAEVLHGGTRRTDDGLVTAGGRVVHVVGRGATAAEARRRAYAAADHIRFDGLQRRNDVGA